MTIVSLPVVATHEWHATGPRPSPPDSLEPSWLELLADDAGLDPEALRELLRREIERRRLTPSCPRRPGRPRLP